MTSDASWTEIVDEHGELVFRIAYRILGCVHDAEDVSQEVLLEAFGMAGVPDAGLLRRMSAFRAIDRLRRRVAMDPIDEQSGPIADRGGGAVCESDEQVECLRQAISRLPRQQSRCFWLRYVEGYSNREIAASLAISESAVSTALNKAKHRLRQLISNQNEMYHES